MFQSRRAPAVGGLYAILTVCCIAMIGTLGAPGTQVASSKVEALQPGDTIVAVGGTSVEGWADVGRAVACWAPTECIDSGWDAEACTCSTGVDAPPQGAGSIPLKVERAGVTLDVAVDDQEGFKAGAKRKLKAAGR